MKAEIDVNGVLIITPESNTERFALNCWDRQAGVERIYIDCNRQTHYTGAKIEIRNDMHWAPYDRS